MQYTTLRPSVNVDSSFATTSALESSLVSKKEVGYRNNGRNTSQTKQSPSPAAALLQQGGSLAAARLTRHDQESVRRSMTMPGRLTAKDHQEVVRSSTPVRLTPNEQTAARLQNSVRALNAVCSWSSLGLDGMPVLVPIAAPDTQRHLHSADTQPPSPSPRVIVDCKLHGGAKSVPVPGASQWEYESDGRATNDQPFHAVFDELDTPSRGISEETVPPSPAEQLKDSAPSVSTCAFRSGSSNGSSPDGQVTDTPSQSYTAEQWVAYHELEEAEMRNEIRRLEAALKEERTRGHQLKQTFAEELMAQKDAHSRDIDMLEKMLAKVMDENCHLSAMVRRLCAQVEAEKDKQFVAGFA